MLLITQREEQKRLLGGVTGNDKLKGEGKVDRGKGKVKDAVAKVANRVTWQVTDCARCFFSAARGQERALRSCSVVLCRGP